MPLTSKQSGGHKKKSSMAAVAALNISLSSETERKKRKVPRASYMYMHVKSFKVRQWNEQKMEEQRKDKLEMIVNKNHREIN